MTSQKQLLFAYGLAVHLLIVGIVCYAAFPTKAPDEPIRLMYKTAAGKVLFDHSTHCNTSGYGATCSDCHHHPSDGTSAITSCGTCHLTQVKPEDTPSSESCLNCHESDDIEDIEMISRVDVFHDQCIRCHEDIESGPQDCSQCHVL